MGSSVVPGNLPGHPNTMTYNYYYRIAYPVLALTGITLHASVHGQTLTASELLPDIGASYHQYTIADAIP